MTNYEDTNQLSTERAQIGHDIHVIEMTIYASRQAIRELRTQVPVDEAAIAEQSGILRAAHGRRHELQRPLMAIREAVEMAAGPQWESRAKPWR